MTKKIRELVYQKYNGKCAYCGHEITIKEMQVDHIVPKKLGGTDSVENYNPSCRICNHYKRATGLEVWRKVFLGELIKRIRKIYIVKVAERYGLVSFHEWDNKFYFEKIAGIKGKTRYIGLHFNSNKVESYIKDGKELIDYKGKTYEVGCGTCDNHDADSCCSCGMNMDFYSLNTSSEGE